MREGPLRMQRAQRRDGAVSTTILLARRIIPARAGEFVSASWRSSVQTSSAAFPHAERSSRSSPLHFYAEPPLVCGRCHLASRNSRDPSRRQAAVAAFQSSDRATPPSEAATIRFCRGSGRASGVREVISSPFNLLSRARCPYPRDSAITAPAAWRACRHSGVAGRNT